MPIYQAEKFLKKTQEVGVKAPVKVLRKEAGSRMAEHGARHRRDRRLV